MNSIAQVLLLAAIAVVVVLPVFLRSRALGTRPDHGADNSSGAGH